MDSWFALIGAYQHGIVMGLQRSFTTASSTQHIWELMVGNRTAVLLRHAWGRRIMSYPDLCVTKFNKKTLKQRAHIQLSMAATARVIWLCAYVRYCPGCGLVYVCSLILSLSSWEEISSENSVILSLSLFNSYVFFTYIYTARLDTWPQLLKRWLALSTG